MELKEERKNGHSQTNLKMTKKKSVKRNSDSSYSSSSNQSYEEQKN